MEITTTELKSKINSGEKMIVEFWAPWCGPCKVMKPTFESVGQSLLEQNSPVKMYTFNIESDRSVAIEFGVRSVPTIKSFSGGKELFTEIGMKDAAALNMMVNRVL